MPERKLYILITIVITLCLLTSCAATQDAGSHSLTEGDLADLSHSVSEADELFKERTSDPSKLRQAVDILAKARNAEHRSFDVEWRFAKYSYFLGKESNNNDEAEAALEKGRDAGRIASRIAPDKPDGYFWYGANLGELSQRSPVTVGLRSINDIREAMNRVIEIEPTYENSSAYDALAQLELATRLTGGKAEKAAELLEHALESEQNNTNLRLHLAEAYLALKRPADARKQLDLLLQMKPDPTYLPEYNDCIAQAKKMLATRF